MVDVENNLQINLPIGIKDLPLKSFVYNNTDINIIKLCSEYPDIYIFFLSCNYECKSIATAGLREGSVFPVL